MSYEELEQIRINYYKKVKKCITISLVIIGVMFLSVALPIILSGGSFFSIFYFGFFAFFGLAIAAVVIVLSTRKDAEAYKKAYKAYFVATTLEHTFTNLNYHHDLGMNREMLANTGMINLGDRYHSNDLVVANYKNVNFVQADAHIEEEHTDSDGDTTYVTIFKGRFMFFEFPKKFNFRLEVVGSKFRPYKVPRQDQKIIRKFEKIQTESTDFNKSFRIFAEDGFEAYYILDPSFMEKIQAIGETYKYQIIFGFTDNKLLVGINDGKDSFEPPKCSKPIDEKAELEKISKDIQVITDFIDKLNLDKKLFQN